MALPVLYLATLGRATSDVHCRISAAQKLAAESRFVDVIAEVPLLGRNIYSIMLHAIMLMNIVVNKRKVVKCCYGCLY